jgi:hypothetical protein
MTTYSELLDALRQELKEGLAILVSKKGAQTNTRAA